MPVYRSRFNERQHVAIERTDGRMRLGQFVRESEEYFVIKGTVGEDIGLEITIPKRVIMQITVTGTDRPES